VERLGKKGRAEKVRSRNCWLYYKSADLNTRIVLALQIHDAELSALLHREPFLRNVKSRFPSHATYRSFEATTSSNWASVSRDGGSETITVDSAG
jgi:hypothetical protein